MTLNEKCIIAVVLIGVLITAVFVFFPGTTISPPYEADQNSVGLSEAQNHAVTWMRIVTIRSIGISNKSFWLDATPEKNPVVIYDLQGHPYLYEFRIFHDRQVVGKITISGQKTLGGPLYDINLNNDTFPTGDQLIVARNFLVTEFPSAQINSIRYVWDDSRGLMIEGNIRNISSGNDDRVFLSAYELQIIETPVFSGFDPQQGSSSLNGQTITEREAMISQWEEGDRASDTVLEFAQTERINMADPITSYQAFQIQNFLINYSIDVPERLPPLIPQGIVPANPSGKPCTSTEAWHTRADQIGAWNGGILVNESLSDNEIRSVLREYNLTISATEPPSSPRYLGYYLEISEVPYESYVHTLEMNEQMNLSFSSPSYVFLQIPEKKLHDGVRVPVFLHKSSRMTENENFVNLRNNLIPVYKTKVVKIETNAEQVPEEREKTITALNNDNRVLFVFKEYLEGVFCYG